MYSWLPKFQKKISIFFLFSLITLLNLPIKASEIPTNNDLDEKNFLELIEQVEDPEAKIKFMLNLAQKYQKDDDNKMVEKLLSKALSIIDSVENLSNQIFLMIEISQIYTQIEDLDQTKIILNENLEKIRQLEDLNLKAAFLLNIADKYLDIDEAEVAEKLVAEANTALIIAKNTPLPFPFEPLPFSGNLRLGANLFFARDELANFNSRIDLSKRWKRDELAFYLDILQSFDSSRPDDEENRLVLDIVSQYKHYFDASKYIFLNIGYLVDDFSDTSNRLSYFTGFGTNLWRGLSENESLNMQLGIGDITQDNIIQNTNTNFPVFQYAIIYKDLFLVDWKFQQTFILELPASNIANYYIDSNTTLSIPAINLWYIFLSLNFRYFGITGSGNDPNLETRFITGIEYSF